MTRRFSEEEAQRIFARVAERQRLTPEHGLSLAELEEAARAAGLDPSLVASAAAELDAAPGPDQTLAGAPVEIVRQRVVAGPVDDDTWAQMVAAARAEFGEPGVAGQIGRLREWTDFSGGPKNGVVTRLTVEPAGDGTRITLSRSVREVVSGFVIAQVVQGMLGLLFGVLVLTGVEEGMLFPMAILLGLAALFAAGTQIGTRVWHRQQARQVEALLDRLELAVHDAAPRPAAREAEGAAVADAARAPDVAGAGRLDLDALADEAPGSAATDRRRARA
jgi:hypothetical protein